MFKEIAFTKVYKESKTFSDSLYKFVVSSSQINTNEELINIFNFYEGNLRNLYKDLIKCEKEKAHKDCLSSFKENFDKLRSDTSIKIEKHTTSK
jgi:hypothetical protein